MQLARSGGHRPEKKITAKDIDGHVQSLRLSISEEGPKYRKQSDKRGDIAQSVWEASSAIQLLVYNAPGQTTDEKNFGCEQITPIP